MRLLNIMALNMFTIIGVSILQGWKTWMIMGIGRSRCWEDKHDETTGF
ncbi:hypothetical protein [Bacteroides cellulosilyticus]